MSQQINLYSPIFRKQKKIFSAMAMLQAMGLILVVVGSFYIYLALQVRLLDVQAADSAQRLKSELERLKVSGTPASADDPRKALAERKKTLEARLVEHARALQAFESGALGRVEGFSAYLRALARQRVEGVWLTQISFSTAGGELSITGRALRPELVPAYLERLRSEDELRGQNFTSLEITRHAGGPAGEGTKAGQPAQYLEFVLSSGSGGGRP